VGVHTQVRLENLGQVRGLFKHGLAFLLPGLYETRARSLHTVEAYCLNGLPAWREPYG